MDTPDFTLLEASAALVAAGCSPFHNVGLQIRYYDFTPKTIREACICFQHVDRQFFTAPTLRQAVEKAIAFCHAAHDAAAVAHEEERQFYASFNAAGHAEVMAELETSDEIQSVRY